MTDEFSISAEDSVIDGDADDIDQSALSEEPDASSAETASTEESA